MVDLRRSIDERVEAVVGAHDEPGIYGGEPGDPGLIGPGSVSWELHADMGAIAVAGTAAIVMEILHPLVMAGVHDQSSFREQPLRRARNTMGYVLQTTFGNTDAATTIIERVRRMHAQVAGTAPDGRPYRALDPDLLAWVHTAIPWAIMTAFDRYHRSLTPQEKDRYLAEQALIGRMAGAEWVPESVAELHDFAESVRPQLTVNEQTRAFLDFITGEDGPTLDRAQGRLGLKASMSLMPAWAQQLVGVNPSSLERWTVLDPWNQLNASLLRWAYGTPACARLAAERAGLATPAAVDLTQVSVLR